MENSSEIKEKYKPIKENYIFKAKDYELERWNSKEDEHPIRNDFQRDRDRILYSRAFRRLSGKTQVFTSTSDDHIRTRLTHTLEVSQIARTISKELGLNEDLTEAIALGHDLGHTPFGHVGERTLNEIMNGCYKIKDFNIDIDEDNKGFKHNYQSSRVVDKLEAEPLNLTKETIWGIVYHSSTKNKECKKGNFVDCKFKHEKRGECKEKLYFNFYKDIEEKLNSKKSWSMEGLVVAIADEIAQRHHDIEDAINFGILSKEEICEKLSIIFEKALKESRYQQQKELLDDAKNLLNKDEEVLKVGQSKNKKYIFMNKLSKFIVDFLTTDVINKSKENLIEIKEKLNIDSNETFIKSKEKIFEHKDILDNSKKEDFIEKLITFSDNVKKGDEELHEFLKNKILNSYEAQKMDGVGNYIINKLFEAYLNNPQQLRDKTIEYLYENINNDKSKIEKLNPSDEKNKNLRTYILQEMAHIYSVGDKRNFIRDLHYKILQTEKEKTTEDKKVDTIESIYKNALLRTVCDYIAGMTDKFATDEHKSLYNC